ncbi:hypothetical protein AURDEDRAFT_125760 [Auricularia subglabra TFB-10046 SS5]|nr:hypothetical protein AURDEDRAFT_125760 [Auricularia subglabra TFB-10046 SS5]
MALAQNISFAKSKQQTLIQEISALDYAGPALEEAQKYVTDLGLLKRDAEKRLAEATKHKVKEWKEHLDMRDSIIRKFSHKIVGKGADWDKKASKEEREYLDSFEAEVKEKDAIAKLKANIREAEQNVGTLREAYEQREKLQRELNNLYRSIFDGPTPEAPQDDRLEWDLRNAEDENNREQAALSLQAQTVQILGDAHKALKNLIAKLKEALDHSEMDALEANAITASQMLLQQVSTHMDQARRLNSAVGTLPEIKVPGLSMSDIYFDNIWSDSKQMDRIDAGHKSAQSAEKALLKEIDRAKKRVDTAAAVAGRTAEVVNKARSDLLEFRAKTFETFAQHGPAPAYVYEPSTHPAATFHAGFSQPAQPDASAAAPAFPAFPSSFQDPAQTGPAPQFPSFPAMPTDASSTGSGNNWHTTLLVRRGTQEIGTTVQDSGAKEVEKS